MDVDKNPQILLLNVTIQDLYQEIGLKQWGNRKKQQISNQANQNTN